MNTKYQWEERHYKAVEECENLFKSGKQGRKIYI